MEDEQLSIRQFTIFFWLVGGTVLGILGVLLTGAIPAVVLGWILGSSGAIVHIISQFRKISLPWYASVLITTLVSMVITYIVASEPVYLFKHWLLLVYFLSSMVLTFLYIWLRSHTTLAKRF